MLFGSARMSPYLGGIMRSYDAAKAKEMPGVRKIVPLEAGVIVVATNTWYALQAASAIELDDHGEFLRVRIDARIPLLCAPIREDGQLSVILKFCRTIAGEEFNINSTQQLSVALFDEMQRRR